MNVLEGQRTFKFRESLHTLPCITKQPAHTTFVIHILRVAVGLWSLNPLPSNISPRQLVDASSTLLQKVLWHYKTEVLEAEYVLDEIYPSWRSF